MPKAKGTTGPKERGEKKPPRRKRRSILGRLIYGTVVLGIWAVIAFAGLIAWHAAQLPQHEQRVADRERPFAPELTRLCAFDAAFGQVLGCAPPVAHAVSSHAVVSHYAPRCDCSFNAANTFAPRSRGPPTRRRERAAPPSPNPRPSVRAAAT